MNVHVFGELEGRSIDIVHPSHSFSLGNSFVGVNFGVQAQTYYAGAHAEHSFVREPSASGLTPVRYSRIQLEAPDLYADRELCADSAASGMWDKQRVAVFMTGSQR
ncbi:MAG TPA: hypothetical protein VFZ61_12930 [Polyangiales bacterium]